MPQAPDLFVVCRNCGSEVSAYVTECPYCGTRLRKRAPKLGTADLGDARKSRRPRAPRLPKLRPGEIPGIRPDRNGRPWATALLVTLMAAGTIILAVVSPLEAGVVGDPGSEWWRVATSPFLHDDLWYAVTCGLAVAIFGGLLERRHGPLAPLGLFVLCGMGGMAAAVALETVPLALGANGAALGLVAAWACRPVLEARRGSDLDVDLLGAGVLAVVLLLMPFAVDEASPTAAAAGLLAGVLAGVVLARRS